MKTLPDHLRYTTGHYRLGGLLLAVCHTGIWAILLGDNDQTLIADLQQRFSGARLTRDDAELASDMRMSLNAGWLMISGPAPCIAY